MRRIRTHLTYANLVSTLALLIALGLGSAYAANQLGPKSVGARQLRPGAVTGPKIAGGAVTPDKIPDNSLTGEKINEGSLAQVPSANAANFATTAETSNPETFAKVDAEGTVFPADSKGIGTADVKQGKFPGIYCIDVPGFSPRGAQATPEYVGNGQVSVLIKFGGTESCPAPQVAVRNYNAGSLQKGPFYVVFYR